MTDSVNTYQPTGLSVNHFIKEKCWNVVDLENDFSSDLVQIMKGKPIPLFDWQDTLSWAYDVSSDFSVKTAYFQLISQNNLQFFPTLPWNRLWKLKKFPRVKFFLWLGIWDRILTADKLFRWNLIPSGLCVFCKKEVETTNHLMFSCPKSFFTWKLEG